MSSLVESLRGLFTPSQLVHLEKVRDAMLADPTVLDNHSREKRDGRQEGSSPQEAGVA